MRQFFILAFLAAGLAGCGGGGGPTGSPPPKLMLPPSSEWFPSLVPPSTIAGKDRDDLLMAVGAPKAEVLWIQYVDLDVDRCNDAIVTLALPGQKDGDTTTWTTVTVVFRGHEEGAFTQSFGTTDIWFGLITAVATTQPAGDTETRRQFTIQRSGGEFYLTLHDTTYTSVSSATLGQFSQFHGSTTSLVRVADLSRSHALELDTPRLPAVVPTTEAAGAKEHVGELPEETSRLKQTDPSP